MIPKVYVAGSSKELERCSNWIEQLQQEGIEVTYNWVPAVTRELSGEEVYRDFQLRSFARNDLRGVDEANLVWLLAPTTSHTRGAWVEMGYALALGRRIVVSPPVSTSGMIFARLQGVVECDTDELAYQWVLRHRA